MTAAAAAPARTGKKEPQPQQNLPISGLDGLHLSRRSSLLEKRDAAGAVDRQVLAETGRPIAAKCAEFGVEGEIVEYHPGPVVTTYEFRPAAGIKVNQVMGLSEDLALALSAESIRIERLPGRASVGIEVPNPGGGEIIALRDVLESEKFQSSPSLLTLAPRQGHPRRAGRGRPARDAAPPDRRNDRARARASRSTRSSRRSSSRRAPTRSS